MTDQCQLLLRIYNLIVLKFHLCRGNFLCFVVFQLLFFLFIVQVVFLLRLSGSARFFPAVHTMCEFGNFIRIS